MLALPHVLVYACLNNGYVSFVQFDCIHAFVCHRSCTRARTHLFAGLMAWQYTHTHT